MKNGYRLLITCPDQRGIVAAVSDFIAQRGGWLNEANYYTAPESQQFFMRTSIQKDTLTVTAEEFKQAFEALAQSFAMQWQLVDATTAKRIVILASHASHCVVDLLHRWHSNDLPGDIVQVIANHQTMKPLVDAYHVPFTYIPMTTQDDKHQAYKTLGHILDEVQADLVVLARFMQIIPPELCQRYQGRMLNIHHSFLPSFVGANPYQKAFDRGVKLVGATCHYVTELLDEGPIVEQDVVRVSHAQQKSDMIRLGKDVEANVLARGVRLHLEDRVLIHHNKTVVFD